MNVWRLVIVALVLALPVAAQQRPVTLFVPAFEGPEPLGQNVGTILNLQVWQTLRKAPFPNPDKLSFGDGLVLWDDAALPAQTHESAEEAGRQNQADLVLWGKAWKYGDGVVVQAHLTMPRGDRTDVWTVPAPAGSANTLIAVDMPRLRYDFRPIVLTRAIVDAYSRPDALQVFPSPTASVPVGAVGQEFTALQQEAGMALIESDGVRGWVRLPQLSSNRTEAVDFIGGVIRVMRGDWDGAARLFQNVIANPTTPTTLKVDARLYRALALERTGRSGAGELEQARLLNPYDKATVSYLLMAEIAKLSRLAASDPARGQISAGARRLLETNRYLFPPNDAWVGRVQSAIAPPK